MKQPTAKLIANLAAFERYPRLLREMKEIKASIAKLQTALLANAKTLRENPAALQDKSVADMTSWPETRAVKFAIERARIIEAEIKLLELVPVNTALA